MSKTIVVSVGVCLAITIGYMVFGGDLGIGNADPYGTRPAFEYENDCDWFWNCW